MELFRYQFNIAINAIWTFLSQTQFESKTIKMLDLSYFKKIDALLDHAEKSPV